MSELNNALKNYGSAYGKSAADAMSATLEEWARRVDAKTQEVVNEIDKGLLKAAFYCEGIAKDNAMTLIYNIPIPTDAKGKPLWKRTGLYKASIGSGMDPSEEHGAIIFNSVPYAKLIEFGGSSEYSGFKTVKNRRARPVMTSAVFHHKADIQKIVEDYIRKVCR